MFQNTSSSKQTQLQNDQDVMIPIYDPGWLKYKKLLVLVILVVSFIELLGLPCIRIENQSHTVSYLGVTGIHEVQLDQLPSDQPPLLLLFPLDRSLLSYGQDLCKTIWSTLHKESSNVR